MFRRWSGVRGAHFPVVMVWALSIAWLTSCGGAAAWEIADTRVVSGAGGKPEIGKLTDLGDMGALPEIGGMLPAPDSDGVFVVGERLLVEGADFGKQPTINIGGRPARVLARTGNGGIVTRIPTGAGAGDSYVEVSNMDGRGKKQLRVARFVLATVAGRDRVYAFALSQPKVRSLRLPGRAQGVRFAHDGSAAYVVSAALSGAVGLSVLATTASGGPKMIRTVPTGVSMDNQGGVIRFAVAKGAPVAAIAVAGKLVLLDLKDPRTPAVHDPWDTGIRDIADVALSSDGKRAFLRQAGTNQLVVVSLATPKSPQRGNVLDLLPQERASLVRGLATLPQDDGLIAIAGDDRKSLALGNHTPQLVRASKGGDGVDKTVPITGLAAPTHVAVPPNQAIVASTAVSNRDDRVVIAAAGVPMEALQAFAGGTALAQVQSDLGEIAVLDLSGSGVSLWRGPSQVLALEISLDGSEVYALVVEAGASKSRLGVLQIVRKSRAAKFTEFAKMPLAPGQRGQLAVAP